MTLVVEVTEDLAACHALRRAVFIEEQGIAEADEWDDLDDRAVHLLVRDGDTPVATARLLQTGETGKIGRICVAKEWRGLQLGAKLVEFGISALRARPGITGIELGAQLHAEAFYARFGFESFGPIYDDAGIDHRDMRLSL